MTTMKTLTWGTMPSHEDFEAAFESACPDGFFEVRNCPWAGDRIYVGHVELYKAISEAAHEALFWDKLDDVCGEFAGNVMAVLGFEWV